jgi:hypothetical protein
MKKTPRKISLHRETLHALDAAVLENVDGGSPSTRFCSAGTSCPSYCQVTNCL